MWRGTNKLQPEGWVQSTLRTIGVKPTNWMFIILLILQPDRVRYGMC